MHTQYVLKASHVGACCHMSVFNSFLLFPPGVYALTLHCVEFQSCGGTLSHEYVHACPCSVCSMSWWPPAHEMSSMPVPSQQLMCGALGVQC